jgi:CheY-like chemotaxis protein
VTHKLLLADDSVTIQRVVELTFSGEDIQVITVGDGEQAIARIPVERPDIVLADIGMPKRSGYDVAAFVKGRPDLCHIPVLLLAGAFEPVDDARAQQVKCDGVLVKPFEPQQVVSRVRELVNGATSANDRSTNVLAMPAPQPFAAAPQPFAAIHAEKPARPAASPEAPEAPRKPESKLDDYFQGLDAALAVLDHKVEGRAVPAPEIDDFRASDVPTLEKLLGSTPLHDSGPADATFAAAGISGSVLDGLTGHARTAESAPASPPAAPPSDGGNVILDAFNALLAMEQGEARPPVRPHSATASPAVITDELVDEITRRVVERLAPSTAREMVKQIVGDVAERLVREEIARIKAAASTKR